VVKDELNICIFRYVPEIIPQPNVLEDIRIRLTEKNTASVPSAGLPARPEIISKNPIPASL
jgi:hypothetical protein